MPLTHTLRLQWNPGLANALDASLVQSADAEDNRVLSIADGVTDQEVVMSIDVSALKALYLLSDKAVTIETNNSGAPVNTFTLAANAPFVWTADMPALRDTAGAAVTTDVTKFYITNASGATATINIRVLQDSTP